MARFDGSLKAAAEARLDIEELIAALAHGPDADRQQRQDAIACLLSASEGWREAREALNGAFAAAGRPSWLTKDKD